MSEQRAVLVVGTGLIGTSIALALRERGHQVWLDDTVDAHLRQAVDLGAGVVHRGEAADITVVAVPPRSTAQVVREQLWVRPSVTVTDTASIKMSVQQQVATLMHASDASGGAALASRYVGGHPLAGRERGGPQRARAALFAGRAWVLTPAADAPRDAVDDAEWLVSECGATPVIMSAEEHDRALAVTSHLPQIVASALAAQLEAQPDSVLQLVGQGLRDMTRIASADPTLWADIASGNATPLADALDSLASSLEGVAAALRDEARGGIEVQRLVDAGRTGQARLPGKHGGSSRAFRIVGAIVRDEPGQMARLLGDTAALGVNVEDLRVEHAPGLPAGLIEVFVGPESEARLRAGLIERGWTLVEDDAGA